MISAALVDYGHFVLRENIARSGILDFWYAEVRGPSAYVPCLVRRLLPPYSQGPEYVQMFRARCRDIQSIRHPCMRRPLEFGVIDSIPHAVFGLDPGWNLSLLCTHLEETGRPLPPEVVSAILLPVVHLLASAHARPGAPLVHGALQLASVWVEADGMVHLSDFEIGALQEFVVRGYGKHDPLRQFVAPDRASSWSSPDPAVDVYSTGASMVEMLAIARLSEVQRRLSVLEKLPILARTGVPRPLLATAEACLSQDPTSRPTMGELLRTLRGELEPGTQTAVLRAFLASHPPPMPEIVQMARGDRATARALQEAPRDKSVFSESTMTVEAAEALNEEEVSTESTGRHGAGKRVAIAGLFVLVLLLGYAYRDRIVHWLPRSGSDMVLAVITSDPPGATISYAGGSTIGSAPLRVPVRVSTDGTVTLTAHVPGYFPPEPITREATRTGEVDFDFHLEKRPPGPASVEVVTIPPGASISVDGKPRGRSPLTVDDLHSSQPHTVAARLKGYRSARRTVPLIPGETTKVVLTLERASSPPASGRLTVVAYPPATLFIDGREVGPTGRDRTYRVAPGQRAITIADTRTGQEANYSMLIRPGANEIIEYTFSAGSWRIRAGDAQ